MAANYSLCLGTAGWGVWHSPDAGQSWTRHRAPFPLNTRIQALVAHPKEAHTVLAGGDTGLFVSHDGGARWERIGANGTFADDLVDDGRPGRSRYLVCRHAPGRGISLARNARAPRFIPLDGKLYRFESLVPALDLALGHWMIGRAAQVFRECR